MELQVGPLLKEKGRTQTFSGDEPCPPDLIDAGVHECRGPMRIEGRATSTGEGVLVKGRVRARVAMLCSRCLTAYPLDVEAEFQEEFVPRTRPRVRGGATERDEEGSGRDGSGDEGDSLEFFEGNRIDLTPIVREQLLMAIPMKALCREDCRGLCPLCGQNLNVGTCDCHVDERDPRLAGLRDLLEGDG